MTNNLNITTNPLTTFLREEVFNWCDSNQSKKSNTSYVTTLKICTLGGMILLLAESVAQAFNPQELDQCNSSDCQEWLKSAEQRLFPATLPFALGVSTVTNVFFFALTWLKILRSE